MGDGGIIRNPQAIANLLKQQRTYGLFPVLTSAIWSCRAILRAEVPMRIQKLFASVLLLTAVVASSQERKIDSTLFGAIREGDAEKVRVLVRAGVNASVQDETGATPLMYAAAYASPLMLRVLIEAGANVNAKNDIGATALMWASYDTPKVRLLLERGTDVNAKTQNGVTAVISAALRGNTEVMRLLVAGGAELQSGAVLAPWKMNLTEIAYTSNDQAMRRFVDASGINLSDVTAWMPSPLTRWLLIKVFAWRPQPAASDAELVRALLDKGASANEKISHLTLVASALQRAVTINDAETVRLLIDRGANVNEVGSRGLTPLMFAASGNPNPATVKLLLEKGAKLDDHDQKGRTALDWALLQGETEVTRLLRNAGGHALAPSAPAPAVVSQPRTTRAAMELAVKQLQPASPVFYEIEIGRASC